MRTLQTRGLATLLCGTLSALGAACDNSAEEAAAAEGQEAPEQLPSIKVELPPTPNFDEDKAPDKWEDGAYSIYGLRKNIDERLKEGTAGQDVVVAGWVQEVYVPPPCPEGEQCPPGKQAFVWITDHENQQGKKRAMMVVKYRFQIPEWEAERWKGQPEVMLEEGKRYRFKGKFKRFSDTGFSHDRGLLEFTAYEAPDPATGQPTWIAPPGAPWHPVEVARQEEANARLIEKAQAAAGK